MTNEEMKEIVRDCINKSGVDCLESCWEVGGLQLRCGRKI